MFEVKLLHLFRQVLNVIRSYGFTQVFASCFDGHKNTQNNSFIDCYYLVVLELASGLIQQLQCKIKIDILLKKGDSF